MARRARTFRSVIIALALACASRAPTASSVELAGIELPRYLQTPHTVLELASCGVRNTLWFEHYVAALYVPRGASTRVVQDRAIPKAVLMHVVDERFLPARLPDKWRGPLSRSLDRLTFSQVQRAFAGLAGGDRVIVLYQPREGVSMRVNGRLVAVAKTHGVVDAILEAWKERDTIAERLERLASDHPC